MCGIAGFTGNNNKEVLKTMMDTLVHRGPDEEGVFFDSGINLGHKRLSIIDLHTGRQPIFNEDRTVCVVFNGEIYNYKDLREQLINKGHKFYTTTDTEVLVHLYEEKGADFVKSLNGEFAIAIWDVRSQTLLLARDRLGIRPLYYYQFNNEIIFASELKAILKHPAVRKELNLNSLYSFLRLRYVAGLETMIKGIVKLPQASIMSYRNGEVGINSYWQLSFEIKRDWTMRSASEEFSRLLYESVQMRLMSDVPLGMFISGGVDSSTILALIRKYVPGEIKTFSIGFRTDIDEIPRARRLASEFSTKHNEFYIDKDAYKLLPKVVGYLDEPIGDAIILPTFILAKKAAESVKVVLTGEGADEILGGYIHQIVMHQTSGFKNMPNAILLMLQRMLGLCSDGFLNTFFPYPARLGKKGKNRLIKYIASIKNTSDSYFKLAELFTPDEVGGLLSAETFNKEQFVCRDVNFSSSLNEGFDPMLNKVIQLDIKKWLHDFTLMKQDRLTMAHSLEGRVPFLDHRLVEFCASLPVSFKLFHLQSKSILRRTADNLVPKDYAQAKKRAFYIPTEKCFDAGFDNFQKEVLLDTNGLSKEIFNRGQLLKMVEGHSKAELVDNKQLSALLIAKLWLDSYFG